MSKGSKPSKAQLSKAGRTLASDGSTKAQKSQAGKTLARADSAQRRRARSRAVPFRSCVEVWSCKRFDE